MINSPHFYPKVIVWHSIGMLMLDIVEDSVGVSGPLRPTSPLVYETNYKQH